MKVQLQHKAKTYSADLTEGIDLSIPVSQSSKLNAYHAEPVRMEPFVMGDWIGEVKQGGPVNYRNIFFSPHGHGTHTECVGHISEEIHSVDQHFSQFHCIAQLITISPVRTTEDDMVIMANQLPALLDTDAVIIRTIPNDQDKRERVYSGANPPYLHHRTVAELVKNGCRHLILDLPSIDREEDGGKLLGHRAFWNFPDNPRMECTVTELAFIPDTVADGLYLLNLQVAPFENDAAPSRPVIFPLKTV